MPIRALTSALTDLLQASLANQPGIPENAFKVQVSPPNGDGAKSDLVLFLYRITPNADLRNAERVRRVARDNGEPDLTKPPQRFEPAVPLDLHYLVTIGATPADLNHVLARLTSLGDAIRAIEAASPIALPAVFQEAVWLSLEPMSIDDLARIGACFPTRTAAARSLFALHRYGLIHAHRHHWDRRLWPIGWMPAGTGRSNRAKSAGAWRQSEMGVRSPTFMTLDRIERRVMFALEMVDPVTGRLVSEGLRVTATGFGRPFRTPSGRFVWRDLNRPAKRTIEVKVESLHGDFRPLKQTIETPEYRDNIPAKELVQRFTLQATGLYEPPTGLIAAAGMLIDDERVRHAMPGVEARLQLRAVDDSTVPSIYAPVTDARGGFVAVMLNPGTPELHAPPAPALEGGVVGWVTFTDQANTVRHSKPLPLRKGQLIRITEPFKWAELGAEPPP